MHPVPVRKRREAPLKQYQIKIPKKACLADKVIAFIEQLPVHHGRYRVGKKVKMFEYQKEIIRGLFPDDRSVTHGVVSLPRAQAKSQIAVWCILAHLLLPELQSPSAQILAISVGAKQAMLLFNSCVDIIDLLPIVTKVELDVTVGKQRISNPEKGIRFQVVASDTSGARLQGYRPDFIVLDEAASFESSMPYQSCVQAMPKLILLISTQCFLKSIAPEHHYFTKLLQAQDLADHHFRYFKGASAEEAKLHWDKQWVWEKVTPAPEIKPMNHIKQLCDDAKRFGTETDFKVFQLNALVRRLSDEITIATEDELNACYQPKTKLADGAQCILGLDLSMVHDLTALVLLSASGQTESYFYVPRQAVTDVQGIVPYDRWHDEGYVKIVNDKCISFKEVAKKVLEYQKKYQLLAVCKDSWLSNHYQLVAEEVGVSAKHIDVQQSGRSMGVASLQLQKFIKSGQLKINNPCLKWNLMACSWSKDTHGNIRPHKQLSQAKAKGLRIDGILALTNACFYISEYKLNSILNGYYIGFLGD